MEERRKLFIGAWIRFVMLRKVTKQIADKYNIHRDKEIKSLRTNWWLRRIANEFRAMQRRKARQKLQRDLQYIRMSLSFSHPNLQDTVNERIKPIINNFLEQTTMRYDFRNKMLICYNQLLKIKTTWAGSYTRKKIRKSFMLSIWKEEITHMIDYWKQKFKNKRLRFLWKKLTMIDEKIRARVIELYLEFATVKYDYQYFVWRRGYLQKNGR